MNCIEGLKQVKDNSVDAIVTDPPYELGFMGKKWDSTGIAYSVELWKECLRVLKHGGHLLSFGGTRTYHRMACAIEDAGFEIRDQIQWIYGQGFPKSTDINKQIHKIDSTNNEWIGYGTGLKPANEPIVMARKPLSEKNIALNVLKWGTGGVNIDSSRIEFSENDDPRIGKGYQHNAKAGLENGTYKDNANGEKQQLHNDNGRFPANVILDEFSAELLDEQSGILKSGSNCVRTKQDSFLEHGGLGKAGDVQRTYGDSGGASRFFWCAKATKKEKGDYNNHVSVKPLRLMEYLVRLVTPENGIVLDPFAGSGSTLLAAKNQGYKYIGFEMEKEYIEIIHKRLS